MSNSELGDWMQSVQFGDWTNVEPADGAKEVETEVVFDPGLIPELAPEPCTITFPSGREFQAKIEYTDDGGSIKLADDSEENCRAFMRLMQLYGVPRQDEEVS